MVSLVEVFLYEDLLVDWVWIDNIIFVGFGGWSRIIYYMIVVFFVVFVDDLYDEVRVMFVVVGGDGGFD